MTKTFKDLRESAPKFIRTPAEKAIWNKSVLLNPKNFSEPTKDDNVFKAANMPGPHNKNDDHAAKDDVGQGYHNPYMFGDYLNTLLAMEEVSEDGMAFVEAVMEMDEEAFLDFMAEEIPDDLAECMMESWGAKEQGDYNEFKKKRAQRPDSEKAKDKDSAKKTVAAFAKEEAEQVDELMSPTALGAYAHHQGAIAAKFHAAHSKKEREPIHKALRAKALSRWHEKLKPLSSDIHDKVGSIEAKRDAMKMRKEETEFTEMQSRPWTPEMQKNILANDKKRIDDARAARKAKGKPGLFRKLMDMGIG